MSPELAASLRALPRRGEHVVMRQHEGTDQRHTPHSIRWYLNKVQADAHLPPTGPHFLRHSGITALAGRDCPPWKLQAHARHARISTTERYIHKKDRAATARAAAEFWTPPAQTGIKRRKPAKSLATRPN